MLSNSLMNIGICDKETSTYTSFLEYILAFLIIINCNTIYSQYISGVTLFGLISFVLILLIFSSGMSKVKIDMALFVYMFIIVYYSLPFFNIDDFSSQYRELLYIATFFITFPLFIIYFRVYRNNVRIFLVFSNLMAYISLMSFVLWLLCSILKILPMSQFVLNHWASFDFVPSYYYIYFETQKNVFLGIETVRNSAFFSEAPMFAICVSIAFAIEIMLRRRIRIYNVIFLILGILSTTSVTAMILAIITLLMQRRLFIKTVILKGIITIIAISASFIVIFTILEDKKVKNEQSYGTRMKHLQKGVLAFEKNTILGTGFYSQTKENSNSCLVLLSEMGIYGAFPFIWGLMLKPLILSRQHGYYHVGMLFLVFFVGYCFTIITYCCLSLLFVSFMLSLKKNNKILF